MQIHPRANNIDIKEYIIHKLSTNFSNLLFNNILI